MTLGVAYFDFVPGVMIVVVPAWTGASQMRAFEVFAIYVTPFLILGAAVKFWMKRHAVDLRDAQRVAGRPPRRRFLLGAWRNEE
jgi:hypothetical protein